MVKVGLWHRLSSGSAPTRSGCCTSCLSSRIQFVLFTLQKRVAHGMEAGDLATVTADTLHLFEGAEDTDNFFTPGKWSLDY